MPFERKIIRHQPCPRCDAIADIRRDGDDLESPPLPGVVLLTLVCPKCKLTRAAGMTTEKVLGLEKQLRDLEDGLSRKANQSDLRRFRARIRETKMRLERAKLGV